MNKKGFTLVEIMVVMAIIAVLATLVIGAVQLARSTATETTHRANAKSVQVGLEGAFAKHKAYCGVTGTPTCGVTSLQSAATSLGVTNLGKSSCPTGTNEGGGRIYVLTGVTYAIGVADSGCTAWTDASDVLRVGTTAVLPTF